MVEWAQIGQDKVQPLSAERLHILTKRQFHDSFLRNGGQSQKRALDLEKARLRFHTSSS